MYICCYLVNILTSLCTTSKCYSHTISLKAVKTRAVKYSKNLFVMMKIAYVSYCSTKLQSIMLFECKYAWGKKMFQLPILFVRQRHNLHTENVSICKLRWAYYWLIQWFVDMNHWCAQWFIGWLMYVKTVLHPHPVAAHFVASKLRCK